MNQVLDYHKGDGSRGRTLRNWAVVLVCVGWVWTLFGLLAILFSALGIRSILVTGPVLD
ncbi:MAG: hypothetical protein FWD61_00475 [Phycisphaerales bacterium]|nr:hypothetical protein [Phycisphaerales bacterium]